jgi:2,3,4,5-tetrahydropyridine-2-carboxylate N-succinyltransferase
MSPPRKKPAKTGERVAKKSARTARAKTAATGDVPAKAAQEKAASKKSAPKKTEPKKAGKKSAAPKTTAGGAAPAAISKMASTGVRAASAPKKAAGKGPGVDELKFMIESAWERRTMLTLDEIDGSTRPTVERVIEGLETGEFRVAEPDGKGGWTVNEWLKKAVLLYFRTQEMQLIEADPAPFWDKVPARFADYGEAQFRKLGVRVVPGTVARRGSHIARDVVLMPSFVNIGAWIGTGTMVDTWATVGSCAQIGAHCHISGGAGIGGVLEPLQAAPTIIEDHCFIGARSEIVEGVVVGHHSVIGMGVFIGQSTRIYNRASGEIGYGRIPPYSVVVSGSLRAKDGSHSLYCAVIVKQVDAKTRSKTSINELLRGHAE